MKSRPPWVVSDELWGKVMPLLPSRDADRSRPGRKPLCDRKALCGILFVLHTGIPWVHLPQELGFGAGMTSWRRLRDWNEAGAWPAVRQVLEGHARTAPGLDWARTHVGAEDSPRRRGRAARIPDGLPGGPGTGARPQAGDPVRTMALSER